MTKRYRITNKFRFITCIVFLLLFFSVFMNFILQWNTADSLTQVEYMEVEIMPGDTLWSIAETYMDDSTDVRQAVYQLCKINQISANELYAGMTLQVPQSV